MRREAVDTHDTAPEEREYVLGTNDAELVRLGFQHQVWAAQTSAAWERAGFRPGSRLLDVGCGPGYGTFDLARLASPGGSVMGVDVSERFLAYLREECVRRGITNIDTAHGDLTELELPDATFDGAFARWVLCFVSDPAGAVARVARTLKPGGTFAVLDYVHYGALTVAPSNDVLERVIAAVTQSFRNSGGNPNVGQLLPGYMHAAGLEVRSVRPIVRTARPGSALWEWPATFFVNFLPSLVAAGTITNQDRLDFHTAWEERSRSRDAFVLTPPMVEVIGVRA